MPAMRKRIDVMRDRKSERKDATTPIPISSNPQPTRLGPAGESPKAPIRVWIVPHKTRMISARNEPISPNVSTVNLPSALNMSVFPF